MMMPPDDRVLPFQAEGLDVRGRVVRLGPAIDNILGRHAYPAPVSRALGEAVALTLLLGTTLKFDGRFIVQTTFDLQSFDSLSGVSNFGFPLGSMSASQSTPAVAGGKIFYGNAIGVLAANDLASAANDWVATGGPDALYGSPVVANGVVYIDTETQLRAHSASTGAILWSAAANSSFAFNAPVIADGIVFFASDDGLLTAYSINGDQPAAHLPGGLAGLRPAIASLHPDLALKPAR